MRPVIAKGERSPAKLIVAVRRREQVLDLTVQLAGSFYLLLSIDDRHGKPCQGARLHHALDFAEPLMVVGGMLEHLRVRAEVEAVVRAR